MDNQELFNARFNYITMLLEEQEAKQEQEPCCRLAGTEHGLCDQGEEENHGS